MITLVFSGFSLILHLAHHIAKFRRSCCKSFAAKRTFKLKAHCVVSSVNWDSEFCLWCGVGRSSLWNPCLGIDLVGHETVYVDLNYTAN